MTVKRFALTPGEPAGIGPDLCLLLARDSQPHALIAIASIELLRVRAAELGLPVRKGPRRVREEEAGRVRGVPHSVSSRRRGLRAQFPSSRAGCPGNRDSRDPIDLQPRAALEDVHGEPGVPCEDLPAHGG